MKLYLAPALKTLVSVGVLAASLGIAHAAAAADDFTTELNLKFNLNSGDNNPLIKNFLSPGAPGQGVSDFRDLGKVSPNTAAFGAAGGSVAAGKLGVLVSGLVSAGAPNTNASVVVQSIATLHDTLTIAPTAARPAGTVIHLVNLMNLSGSETNTFQAHPSTQGRPNRDFVDAVSSVDLFVSGTGVGGGPGGKRLLRSVDGFSDDFFNFGPISEHVPQPDVVEVAMDLIVGQATPLSLTLTLTGIAEVFDQDFLFNRPGSAQFNADFSHTLAWGADTVLTDPLTGEVLNGLEIASASGFDYLHGGEAGDPGGVPEPAAWALMILGFASVGGVLRRRRLGFCNVTST